MQAFARVVNRFPSHPLSSTWNDVQQRLLEIVERGAPLGHTLDRLAAAVETQLPGSICTILLFDAGEGRFWNGAGPTVPWEFMQALHGASVGPETGSCGKAVFDRDLVVTAGISTDPLWTAWSALALRFDLRSCWSLPIVDSHDNVLGTLALYQRKIAVPDHRQLHIAKDAVVIARIAIGRARSEDVIRTNEKRMMLESSQADVGAGDRPSPASEVGAQHAQIIDGALDVIVAIDDLHRIVVFNSAAERTFNVPASIAVGSLIDEYLPRELLERYLVTSPSRGIRVVDSDVAHHPVPVRIVQGDGTPLSMEATVAKTTRSDGTLLSFFLRDVAEREQSEARLRRSQNMESMSKLTGGIAHDFNNLLTTIRANAELLLDDLPSGQSRTDAEEIRSAADRAASLVRQLLAFSRRQVLRPSVVDLNVVVRSVARLVQGALSDEISLRVSCTDAPAWVLADSSQLEHVVLNVVMNAREAIRAGGTIEILTRVARSDEIPGDVRVRTVEGVLSSAVVLSIRDNGVGMDESVRERAFEPFFTTKTTAKGAGLGLAMVYGIVEQSKGTVSIQSKAGSGTTVWVVLPLSYPASDEVDDGAAADGAAADGDGRGHGTILLVEDQDAVRAIVKRVLTAAGYLVVEASTPGDALSLWRSSRAAGANIDAVVTDMIMPGRTGRELVQDIRLDRPEIPVLFMSGYVEGGLTPGETGVHSAFIEKPFTPQKLLTSLGALLETRVAV